ncbi:MAG: bifunctional diaminohydroxyphosphoribosylaminopyrimidine deaminase/5-amino-6-(5-phosphoribosylamino)uracil reductase RibD [Phycisphaerales bacterium]|nr:bifunctional diaminohydroxyphosphoribosylaminopyrimidine deaminase/5-amino-6-(5-phosphoribosylamino)uracil reductase RibD [Phycisphaerales bacterium]
MKRALALARRGRGAVEPNPMVGCVLVRKGRVIGEGWHRRFGGPHAEVEALRRAGDARGATAYVTLEPCCHHGKTPPCTDALLAAGIARVVAGVRDPNAPMRGRGFALLRRRGVQVEIGVCAEEAAALIAPFEKLIRRVRPWVTLKWAQSLDGCIATRTGDSRWISDEACRAHAHRTRGLADAILVGVGTVLRDDPLLTCRVGRPRRTATRIVLDSLLRTPESAALIRTAREAPTLIYCHPDAPSSRRRRLEARGSEVRPIGPSSRKPRRAASGTSRAKATGLPVAAVLDDLGQRRFTHLLVEGGARVLGAFADAAREGEECADAVNIYCAPILIGGEAGLGALGGVGAGLVADALRSGPTAQWRRLGNGWFLEATLRRPGVR